MTGTVAQLIDPLDAESVEQLVVRLGTWRNSGDFDPMVGEILAGLSQTERRSFESALVKLGLLAGATDSVGDGNAQAAPDASWAFGSNVWVTWEAKSEAQPDGEVSVGSVRQANGHLRYMADDRNEAIPSGSLSALTTPQTRIHPTAVALAESHTRLVTLAFPLELAQQLVHAWRVIRTSVAPDTDPEQARRAIYDSLMRQGCLPTQWLESLDAHPVRLPAPPPEAASVG
jgi:hypothetical protein